MRVTLNIPLHIREGIHESENNYQRIDERRDVVLALLEQPKDAPPVKSRFSHTSYRIGNRTLHDTLLIVECEEPKVYDLNAICRALRQPALLMRTEDGVVTRITGKEALPAAAETIIIPHD